MTKQNLNPRYSHILIGISLFTFLGIVNGLYNPVLYKSNPLVFWIVDFIHYWALPITFLYILYKTHNFAPREYGLKGPDRDFPVWEMLGAGIFTAIILVIVWTVFWYIGLFIFGRDDFEFSFNLVIPDGALRIPVILYLSLSAGLVEEIVFRGLPWAAILKMNLGRYRKAIYIITSSILFAAVHWEQGLAGVASALGFGIVAVAFYLHLKNLWPMIAAHSIADIYFFW